MYFKSSKLDPGQKHSKTASGVAPEYGKHLKLLLLYNLM
jgi:hypothetical protein